MGKRPAVLIALAVAGVLALASSAGAGTIKVTNTNDSGPGSLRTAIHRANQIHGFDRIVVDATGTIELRSGLPHMRSKIAIRGRSSKKFGLDGSALVSGPRRPAPVSVSRRGQVAIRRISIEHGGAAIRNRGTLAVLGSRLSDTIGSGIVNNPGAQLTLKHTTVTGSEAHYIRSGIFDRGGTTQVRDSTIALARGGIAITGGADLTIERSTLIQNWDGVSNYSGSAKIDRSTIADNLYYGVQGEGSTTITETTLSGNASKAGTGYATVWTEPPGTIELQSTILANAGSSAPNCVGPVSSSGYNLSDDDSCNLTAQGDQPNADPLLGPLGDYGGPTKTFALPAASPAVDAGYAGTTPTDQRGLRRIVDYPGVPTASGSDGSDIGSFELHAPQP